MSLDAELGSLISDRNWEGVYHLLDKAHSVINFWGTRLITVDDRPGTVLLDSIVQKILTSSEQTVLANRDIQKNNNKNKSEPFTIEDQFCGVQIVTKLVAIYNATDYKINKNLLTRILVLIRNFLFHSNATHLDFEIKNSVFFRTVWRRDSNANSFVCDRMQRLTKDEKVLRNAGILETHYVNSCNAIVCDDRLRMVPMATGLKPLIMGEQ